MQLVRILNLPGDLFPHLNLVLLYGKGKDKGRQDDRNQATKAWDGHSDARKDGVDGDVDDHFDDN